MTLRKWPQTTQEPVEQVDWFRLLTQLQAEGYSLHGVAFFTRIPKASLIEYKNSGRQPTYNTGLVLISAWSEIMGQPRENVPMISPYSFKA